MDLRQVANTLRTGASSPLALTSRRLPRNKFARFTPHPSNSTGPLRTITNPSRAPQQSTDSRQQTQDPKSNNTQARPQPQPRQTRNEDLDTLLNLLTNDPKASSRSNRPSSTSDARAFMNQQNRRAPSWLSNMNMPGSPRANANAMPTLTNAVQEPDTGPAPFRLGPTLGRTVEIGRGPGTDLARGLRSLDARLKRERVKNDWFSARFHERPGLRRKRLHSERWRRRFKLDFQATVSRVQDLVRKGW